jgi:hypothetical protein
LDWLLEALAPAGDIARRDRGGRAAFGPGDETAARAAIAAVHAAAAAAGDEAVDAIRAAIRFAGDPGPVIASAANGDLPDDVALFEAARFLEGLERARSLCGAPGFEAVRPPAVDPDLIARFALGRSEASAFYLSDRFDDALAEARRAAERAEFAFERSRERLAARVAAAAGLESIRPGEFILLRAQLREAPPGVHVIRETPAYWLCELTLDEPALAALAERDAARARVAHAEERVRAGMRDALRSREGELRDARAALGRLDDFTARVRFAQRYATCVPEIDASGVEVAGAVFLPLAERVEANGGRYTPISFALEDACILTGPNMGGKSAALRACGFVAACVLLGVPPPAARVRLPLFDQIAWLGLGGERSGERLLSAFGSEVVELRDALDRPARRRLLLVDEFARSTTPAEGAALLIALVASARSFGACLLAATHFAGIASRAGVRHYAIAGPRGLEPPAERLSLERAIGLIGAAMDYRLVEVGHDEPPAGDALALAAALGVDPAIVEAARQVLAKEVPWNR